MAGPIDAIAGLEIALDQPTPRGWPVYQTTGRCQVRDFELSRLEGIRRSAGFVQAFEVGVPRRIRPKTHVSRLRRLLATIVLRSSGERRLPFRLVHGVIQRLQCLDGGLNGGVDFAHTAAPQA